MSCKKERLKTVQIGIYLYPICDHSKIYVLMIEIWFLSCAKFRVFIGKKHIDFFNLLIQNTEYVNTYKDCT